MIRNIYNNHQGKLNSEICTEDYRETTHYSYDPSD